jgi:hypothetical protein
MHDKSEDGIVEEKHSAENVYYFSVAELTSYK